MEGNNVYYFPAIKEFEDTGFVKHMFADGSCIKMEVVESNDSEGFALHLVIENEEEVCCDMTFDRFAGLALADAIIKNLLNQEEIIYVKQQELMKSNNIKWKKGNT